MYPYFLLERAICEFASDGHNQCDGKRPACSQCVFKGQTCGGYDYDFIFIEGNNRYSGQPMKSRSTISKTASSSAKPAECKALLSSTLAKARSGAVRTTLHSPTAWSVKYSSLDDIINLIIFKYTPENELPWLSGGPTTLQSRICGNWVQVLPSLAGRGRHENLLAAAINSLGISILGKAQHQVTSPFQCFQAYSLALRALAFSIWKDGHSFSDEMTAAILCVAFTEVCTPPTESLCVAQDNK